jgi:hypothetical protein
VLLIFGAGEEYMDEKLNRARIVAVFTDKALADDIARLPVKGEMRMTLLDKEDVLRLSRKYAGTPFIVADEAGVIRQLLDGHERVIVRGTEIVETQQ